jgi:O-antigen/teichoic acid export membrane protein
MSASNDGDQSHRKPLSIGLVYLIASTIAHGLNFLFQMIMGRLFGASQFDQFGVMNTMINICGMVALPMIGLQLAIARQTAIFAERGETDSIAALLIRATRKACLGGVVLFLAVIVISPWLKSYLHLDSYGPILVTAALFGVGLIFPVAGGAMQGLKRFGWMSVIAIASPTARIAIGVGLVWLGWRATGALMGTLAANAIVPLVVAAVLFPLLRSNVAVRTLDTSGVYRYLGPTMISCICYAGLVNLDMPIVKHYFTGDEAAQYSLASLFGRAIGWLITPLSAVLFPHVWDEQRHTANRALLLKFLVTSVALAIVAAIGCSLIADRLTWLVLKRPDETVTSLIPLCAWAMLPIGVANIFLNFVMARGRYGFLAVFVVVTVLYVVTLALVCDATHSFRAALAVIAGFGTVTLGLFVAVTYTARPAPTAS